MLNELLDEIVIDKANEKSKSSTEDGPSWNDSIASSSDNEVKMSASTFDEENRPKSDENDVIKCILDSLITTICEKSELKVEKSGDKSESGIVKECLEEILEKVCQGENCAYRNIISKTKKVFSKVNIKNKYIKKKTLLKRTFDSTEEKTRYIKIAERCLEGFGFCLRRFYEYYKSQYTMAHFLANCPELKDLQWSRDLLLGGSGDHQTYSIPLPVHGIFSGKKKTNLFQYVWRVPVNEIDRPGSFCTHNCQSITLLLSVLSELMDNSSLIHVSAFLHKTPDKERKYLRDEDRALLAIKAFDMVLDILKKRCKVEKYSNVEDEMKLLMDAYEAYKHSQKMQISQQTCEFYVLTAYERYKNVKPIYDSDEVSLEGIIKLCQQVKTIG